MNRIAIITGGTSGIGLETAKALSARGVTVYEFSRREAEFDFMRHVRVDVTDEAQVFAAVEQVFEECGRIDILINNAGMGISGAFEFTDEADARRLMDVNLFGMNHTIRAVLPHMRMAKSGRIVNLGSVAGPLPIPFQAWYSISKAAVNALTMALANEVAPFGISVCSVMPGDIQTGFTAARKKSVVGDDVYAGRIERSVSRMEKDEQNGMKPEIAGRFIARIATKKRVKPQNTIGFAYKCCVVLGRVLPVRLVKFILGKMYG